MHIWYIYINIVNDNSWKIPVERYVWKEELRRKNNFSRSRWELNQQTFQTLVRCFKLTSKPLRTLVMSRSLIIL